MEDEVEQCDEDDGEDTLQPWTVDTLIRQFGVEEKGFSLERLKAV